VACLYSPTRAGWLFLRGWAARRVTPALTGARAVLALAGLLSEPG
jgi:hypothetical protein